MSVSLVEVLVAARAHAAPLAGESAGYLLLAIADHLATLPRQIAAQDVQLQADGSVRLARPTRPGAADEVEVERQARELLGRVLAVASSVGPALRRAAERAEPTGIAGLVRELEAALIPVNRSAARRALSRLHRETSRARDAGKLKHAAEPVAIVEPILQAAVFPDPSPVLLPEVVVQAAEPVVVPEPLVVAEPIVVPELVVPDLVVEAAPAPVVLPEPPVSVAPPAPETERAFAASPMPAPVEEGAFTKPEPVVLRAKARASRTPAFGTLVAALSTSREEPDELTERAPSVAELEEESSELEVPVEIEAPISLSAAADVTADPEPSCLPDVVMAMVGLHTGLDPDEAPTRIRDVVTSERVVPQPAAASAPAPADAPLSFALEPEPEPEVAAEVDEAWLTQSSLAGVVTSGMPMPVTAQPAEVVAPPVTFVAEPFVNELGAPELHEALTWDPGPVHDLPLAPALLVREPAPEPVPYTPAELSVPSSDVSELADHFHVSAAPEERELRSALKEMAGLSLTPLPNAFLSQR